MIPPDATWKPPVLLAAAAMIALSLSPDALGSRKSAVRSVREGVRSYRSGDYQAAGRAFDEADVALPENDVIAFNKACVHAARGDAEKAVELFEKAAISRDEKLAAGAHYNLGCVAVGRARSLFGDKPEEATADVRAQGLELLGQAVRHYRDCLQTNSSHAAARRNLEIIRLWIKHMREVWADRDRRKRREETNLLEFLEMIQSGQEGLRGTARALGKEQDSPKRRQATTEAETAQRALADEIEPLKQKIAASLQLPPASGPAAGQPTPQNSPAADAAKAAEALARLADRSKAAMLRAADDLASRPPNEAVRSQTDALDTLNEIYLWVAPFAHLLGKATTAQQGLVDRSSALVEHADAGNSGVAEKDNAGKKTDETPVSDAARADFPEMSRDQTKVERWSQALPLKAQQQLKQLAAAPSPRAGAKGPQADPGLDAQQAEQARQALRQSLERAVQSAPAIQRLAREAAERLAAENAAEALPKQREALRLLKEIAESLPKQQPPNQGGQNQQQKPGEGGKRQQDSASRDSRQPAQQQPDLSRRQAEAILQRVRERERTHRDLRKQLRGGLRGATVDKDW